MWPGYGENSRVLDWILRRIDDEPNTARVTPIGNVPTRESFNVRGLDVDFDGLFSVPVDFWTEEASVYKNSTYSRGVPFTQRVTGRSYRIPYSRSFSPFSIPRVRYVVVR